MVKLSRGFSHFHCLSLPLLLSFSLFLSLFLLSLSLSFSLFRFLSFSLSLFFSFSLSLFLSFSLSLFLSFSLSLFLSFSLSRFLSFSLSRFLAFSLSLFLFLFFLFLTLLVTVFRHKYKKDHLLTTSNGKLHELLFLLLQPVFNFARKCRVLILDVRVGFSPFIVRFLLSLLGTPLSSGAQGAMKVQAWDSLFDYNCNDCIDCTQSDGMMIAGNFPHIAGMLIGRLFCIASINEWCYQLYTAHMHAARTHDAFIPLAQETLQQVQPRIEVQYGLEIRVLHKDEAAFLHKGFDCVMIGLGWDDVSQCEGSYIDLDKHWANLLPVPRRAPSG
jgi:hypothetical protein